jgi:hypothetical protein
MALVVSRIQVFPIPARGKESLRTHLRARGLSKLNGILSGVKADVRDVTVFRVGAVVGIATGLPVSDTLFKRIRLWLAFGSDH